MTIKQQGGIFGRNPTFNDVEVEGQITIGGAAIPDPAQSAQYDDTTANFTGTLQNGGSDVLVDTDIGSTVQAYDADTAKYDDATANFTGTLQEGGQNVVTADEVGTIASQAANNVNIDGGAIDGTTIGANAADAITVTAFDIDPTDDQGVEHIHGASSTFYQNGTVDLFTMTVPYTTSGNGYWGVVDLAVAARTSQSSDDVSQRVANVRIIVSRTGNNSGTGSTGVDVQVDESTNAYSEVGTGGSSSAITVAASAPAASTSDHDVVIQLTIANDAGTAAQARWSGMFMGHRGITFS